MRALSFHLCRSWPLLCGFIIHAGRQTLVERPAQRLHLIVQMPNHRALSELRVFLEKGVHDLVMLAHRMVKSLRQTERENPRLANFSAQLINEPIKTLVSGDLSDKTMKAAAGLEIAGQI